MLRPGLPGAQTQRFTRMMNYPPQAWGQGLFIANLIKEV